MISFSCVSASSASLRKLVLTADLDPARHTPKEEPTRNESIPILNAPSGCFALSLSYRPNLCLPSSLAAKVLTFYTTTHTHIRTHTTALSALHCISTHARTVIQCPVSVINLCPSITSFNPPCLLSFAHVFPSVSCPLTFFSSFQHLISPSRSTPRRATNASAGLFLPRRGLGYGTSRPPVLLATSTSPSLIVLLTHVFGWPIYVPASASTRNDLL